MTRPTKEQIDALKPGDRYTVELTFQHRRDFDVIGKLDGTYGCVIHEPSSIHSILPREIKVGDRVRLLGVKDCPLGTVKAVGGERAFVEWIFSGQSVAPAGVWRDSRRETATLLTHLEVIP